MPVKIEPFHLGHFDAVGPEGPLYSHAPPSYFNLEVGRRPYHFQSTSMDGGQHHGYFLPSEGSSDRALALFSFPTWQTMKPIGVTLVSIPSLSRPIAFETRAAAFYGTTARSCDRCYRVPDVRLFSRTERTRSSAEQFETRCQNGLRISGTAE